MKIEKTASDSQKITMSKDEWRLIGKQAGWTKMAQPAADGNRPGSERLPNEVPAQTQQQPQQDDLDTLLYHLMDMNHSQASPILDKFFGVGFLDQLKNEFLQKKLAKYKTYTPEQRLHHSEKLKRAGLV